MRSSRQAEFSVMQQTVPSMESQIKSGSAWIGHPSMQINFNMMPQDEAMRSLGLFATEVIPRFLPALAG